MLDGFATPLTDCNILTQLPYFYIKDTMNYKKFHSTTHIPFEIQGNNKTNYRNVLRIFKQKLHGRQNHCQRWKVCHWRCYCLATV